MDSQLTLVEPLRSLAHPQVEPGVLQPTTSSTILYLTPGNVKQCTISFDPADSSKALYIIDSNLALTRTTITRRSENQPFAVVDRREFLSDKISFSGGEKVNVNKRLRPLKTFSTFPVAFEERGNAYIWKSSIVGQLALYMAQAPDTPIAWFQCSRKQVINGVPTITPAFLVLQPEAVEIQDIAVVSFLVLEHKSRMNTKSTELRAGVAVHGIAMDGY